MEKFDKKIEGIRKMLKDMKSEKYAFVNPELVAMDEYVKGLYLKVLCTLIQYENEPTDMQILFLKRIINGIGVDDSVEEYMRKALEISETDIQEFLSTVGKNTSKYYFTVDGIILSSLGKGNTNCYEYLAELIELLEINKDDLEYLCMVVKSVLVQESSYYDQAKTLTNERVENLDFTPYIQNYYAGIIVYTDIVKHYSAPDKTLSYNIEYISKYKERKIVFENVEIHLEFNWKFEGCEEVVFRNCTLVGKEYSMKLNSIGSVTFESCRIQDFSDGVAYITSVNHIVIKSSEFINCGRTGSRNFKGGMFIISGDSIDDVFIQGNKFHNCYVKAGLGAEATGVFIDFNYSSGNKLSIISNEFTGCNCISGYNGRYISALISGLSSKSKVIDKGNRFSGGLQRLFENASFN